MLDLITDEGINASGKDEIYGCIFGRDSFVTILKILKAITNKKNAVIDKNDLLAICRRSLLKLASLQGKEVNIESGEEPGKFIHEYRKDKYDHLLKLVKPWYVYADKTLRNYDSIDSTPLALIAIYRYWQITRDNEFLSFMLPHVEKGLVWLISYADYDRDKLIEYEFHKGRKFGGLEVQSWTDSLESLRQVNGKLPMYPIAPVEVQGYAWLALKHWSEFFGRPLMLYANRMKQVFNKLFIFKDKDCNYAAQALDGAKNKITTITANPLLLLWATYEENGCRESIIDEKYIPDFIRRASMEDLFDPDAGLRTMSTQSPTFNPRQDSYHNGSFWPKLNGQIHEGLEIWGFREEAKKLKAATLKPLIYFKTPIELYIKGDSGNYLEFRNGSQVGCRNQAWSAAAALDLLTCQD